MTSTWNRIQIDFNWTYSTMKSILFVVALISLAKIAGNLNDCHIFLWKLVELVLDTKIFLITMYKLSFNLILSSLHQGGCCCSAHFGYYNCYCNIFNCNCHYSDGQKFTDTEDGYCQYNNFIDHLATMGTGTCHSHWKELACGSRSRIIDSVG